MFRTHLVFCSCALASALISTGCKSGSSDGGGQDAGMSAPGTGGSGAGGLSAQGAGGSGRGGGSGGAVAGAGGTGGPKDGGTEPGTDASDDGGRSSCALPKYPDESCTGVTLGTALKVVMGDQRYESDGQVVSGLDIRGCVNVFADNVTIRNCKITCGGAFGVRTFNGSKDYSGLLIEDTEIDGVNQGFTGVAFVGYTLKRVNVHGWENGVAFGSDATIQDSYIHDLKLTSTEHPDGVQFSEGTSHITLKHNTISAPVTNSAIIMYDQDGMQNSDVTIDGNFLSGGGWTLYCPRQNATNISISNNRFGPAHFGPTSSCTIGHVTTWTNNVDDATGKMLPAE